MLLTHTWYINYNETLVVWTQWTLFEYDHNTCWGIAVFASTIHGWTSLVISFTWTVAHGHNWSTLAMTSHIQLWPSPTMLKCFCEYFDKNVTKVAPHACMLAALVSDMWESQSAWKKPSTIQEHSRGLIITNPQWSNMVLYRSVLLKYPFKGQSWKAPWTETVLGTPPL